MNVLDEIANQQKEIARLSPLAVDLDAVKDAVTTCNVCGYDVGVERREPHGKDLCGDCAPKYANHLELHVTTNRAMRRRQGVWGGARR